MTTLQKAVYDRLSTDWTLTHAVSEGGLGFGVYDRWLVQPINWDNPQAGSTPDAFDRTRGGRLKRSIVVMPGADVDHPSRQPGRDAWRWDAFFDLYLFAEAHATGKQVIETAKLRVFDLLWDWVAVLDRGQQASFRPAGGIALADSEAWPGNVVSIPRWRATASRTVAVA